MDLIQILGVFLASALGAGTFLKFSAEKIIETGLQKALHKEQLLTETDLEFRKRQIEEFYGPIYASLKLNSQIYPLWIEGKIKEVNHDVIDLFKQQNDEITKILKTKAHLMDGGEFPPEFIQFMTSATIWGMYCTRKDDPNLPDHVANIQDLKWPQKFESHIYSKTEELKQTLDDLLIKYRAK
ncbi:MAG TPA: hypothetical protein IGS53_19015 [Leptolyngbyaceae cyanobacterium M33_DOE_097]|uniref:Uncharacterized protein n=1 Tax=Oscillatoriales cyanobacterium SpSt-418 TaxID=2282169 RepID=A0A7C3KGE5_9CYAN|nr:hypothetical protein [Leptolyngbyaceae cyanobacterium M33_DOE_097]